MGILLGKFRKKKSPLQVLENVENEIKSIEEFRRNTEQTQKRIVGRFVVISVGTYLLTAFMFYFYFFPADFYDQLFYIIPLIFAPVIIISVKRGLIWYYKRKISHKQNKLYTLREEKKKLLDEIKETETYKVVKGILEKYAPENMLPPRRSMGLINDNTKTAMKQETPMPSDTILRQRALPPPLTVHSSFVTPFRPLAQSNSQGQIQSVPKQLSTRIMDTPAPLPREILPRERSVLDKMVDYLMGDGPSNRYALICKNCFSHNGMAHKDEFEYVSFRCCYCFTMNLARKKRPGGPKLEYNTKAIAAKSGSSESEKTSPSESETELEHEDTRNVEFQQGEPVEADEPMEIEDSVLATSMETTIEDLTPTTTAFDEVEETKKMPLIDLKD